MVQLEPDADEIKKPVLRPFAFKSKFQNIKTKKSLKVHELRRKLMTNPTISPMRMKKKKKKTPFKSPK